MNGSILQNMAPNAKRSFVVSLIFGSIAASIYIFFVKPADEQLVKDKQANEELSGRQFRMSSELHRAERVQQELNEANDALSPFNEAMLVPLLESYSMRAKSILDPLAIGAGLTNIDYFDEEFRTLPVPKPIPRQLHTRAAVRIEANGSYQRAISFLMRVEKELPFVTLRSMRFSSSADPETQSISMTFEWPAKGVLTRP